MSRKRRESCLIILATVVGSGLVAAAPKVDLDLAKQIFLTSADVAMCLGIWDIYFRETLYEKKLKSIFIELFFVIVVSAITSYIASRGITEFSDRLLPSMGVMGWVVIGVSAALLTSLLGFAWTFYCDDLYKN